MTPVVRAAAGWLGSSAAALLVVTAIGALPTARLGGPGAMRALGAGCAIAAVGALVGALPVLGAVAAGGAPRPHVTAGWAVALRFGATLAGALATALGSTLPRLPLLLWVAIAYGALLVVETRWTLRWLRAGDAQ